MEKPTRTYSKLKDLLINILQHTTEWLQSSIYNHMHVFALNFVKIMSYSVEYRQNAANKQVCVIFVAFQQTISRLNTCL